MTTEYLLNSGTDLGREQLDCLTALLDGHTTAFLTEGGVGPGMRCLDVGAGSGSIARWLAGRTAPGGTVVTADLETTHLCVPPEVRVHRHDINDGVPEGGPFDLVHARLVLMHLRRREEILRSLADALAPGGTLVLGEFSDRPLAVLSAPSAADAELFDRVLDTAFTKVSPAGGVDWEWGHRVPDEMARAGLVNIEAWESSWTIKGGSTECRLLRNYSTQLHEGLLAFGLTEEELARYRDLMSDERFESWFFQSVFVSGRKQREPRSG